MDRELVPAKSVLYSSGHATQDPRVQEWANDILKKAKEHTQQLHTHFAVEISTEQQPLAMEILDEILDQLYLQQTGHRIIWVVSLYRGGWFAHTGTAWTFEFTMDEVHKNKGWCV